MLGEVMRTDGADATSALAVVQAFVSNQGDGGAWTQAMLKRIIDEQAVAPSEGNPFEPYEEFAFVLGRRTGEMHAVLAQPTDDPDFSPEDANERTVQRWYQQAERQIDQAWRALENYSGHARQLVESLRRQRGRLLEGLKALFAEQRGAIRTRIHGDYHLGQVLVSGSDVIIIDFEGEPLKPLNERRAKLSPMRDLAGMIRSFGYAAGIVEREGQLSESGRAHLRAHNLLGLFRKSATDAFLAGYEKGRGSALNEKERRLITAFAIEKAAYEIAYEAANRPDWIDIPLHGLVSLVERIAPTRELENVE
jgi:maltose alpha-D-glucosyltransferase/alpha-amylase